MFAYAGGALSCVTTSNILTILYLVHFCMYTFIAKTEMQTVKRVSQNHMFLSEGMFFKRSVWE